MTIREVPKQYIYSCDRCGDRHVQENANGHYTNSRPPHWQRVVVYADLTIEQLDQLLCPACANDVRNAISIVIPPMQEPLT